MGVENVIEIVKRLVSVDALMSWLGTKMVEEYGVRDIEVKRVKDAVVLVIKGDNLDRVEKELREAVSGLGLSKRIEVDVS